MSGLAWGQPHQPGGWKAGGVCVLRRTSAWNSTGTCSPQPHQPARVVRRDPSPVKWYRGVYRATGIPPAVSRVSASHSLWCAPAARPVGRALEAGSRRNHPAAFRRVLMLLRTPRGVLFLVFRPEKPSAIVRALRCAQVLLTCGSPDSSRKLCPTRSGLAAFAYFVGKLVLLSPVPGLALRVAY